MKDVSLDDVINSIFAADSKEEARKIVDRYCEHLTAKKKHEIVKTNREERKERLKNSGFTKVIEYVDSVYNRGAKRPLFPTHQAPPDNKDVLTAIKLLAEALREREEHFYRRGPG